MDFGEFIGTVTATGHKHNKAWLGSQTGSEGGLHEMKDRDTDVNSVSGMRTESWVGSERLLALTSSTSGSMFSFPSPREGGES